jgi:serine phosphatase RsbU (regulator of sigma subunit)
MAAMNHPARIVSGDLYDVIVIDPERVAILCADVSGKGFPAALMASELQSYVRATLRAACVFADTSLGPLPVQVVALVNNELSRHYGSGRYATMFFAGTIQPTGRFAMSMPATTRPCSLFQRTDLSCS